MLRFSDRLAEAAHLIQHLKGRDYVCKTIIQAAWDRAGSGRSEDLDEAVRLCRESYQLALGMGDLYGQGVSRFYLGLIYFLRDVEEWDQATEHCEESANIFHSISDEHAEGVAWLAAGRISEAQYRSGKERRHQSLQFYLKAGYALENDSTGLEEAKNAYTSLVKSFTQAASAADTVSPSHTPQTSPTTAPFMTQPASPPGTGSAPRSPFAPSSLPPGTTLSPSLPQRWPASKILVIIFLLLLLWIVMASGGIINLLINYPNAFIIGLVTAWFLTIPIVFLFLEMTSRLNFTVPPQSVAIIEYRGRTWVIEEPGRHWLLPFLEQVKAYLPVAPRSLDIFLRDLSTPDGFSFVARVRVRCMVVDGRKVWMAIRSSMQPRRILGVDRPITSEQTTARVEEHAREILCQVLLALASNPAQRAILKQNPELNQHISNLLAQQSSSSGLGFYRPNVELYFRF